MRKRLTIVAFAALAVVGLGMVGTARAGAGHKRIVLREYRVPAASVATLRADWLDQLSHRYGVGTWAPMRFDLSNRDLALMGLPSKRVLTRQRYRVPTAVYRNGKRVPLAKGGKGGQQPSQPAASGPGLVTFAGTGFFGIRPGAWLLLISGKSIGWCSMAHVYGSPGSYQVSTAGHCGKPGDIATAIGVVGNNTPVLIDFGQFAVSHDGGLGQDWALISVYPQYQPLVTPTMAFWGGPIGMFTATGDVASVSFQGNSLIPSLSTNPDPFLAQQLLHYGHGTGIGAGGTPRSGTAISWKPSWFMFFGAISPGDSGSGANTLTGDTVGAEREAAGIMTHLWIDSRLRQGVGIMGGTRATQVGATLANGQLLPYPAPAPILP